ncbi:MAG: hypothetical protein BWY06_01050 [Candidatus Latescibacteria bacterium ADurb.Bin168]|nr:MAG: hypothetical protein BWY06_01050 [Candidatus Latescibacteria bacterium ADurb.Bin168]
MQRDRVGKIVPIGKGLCRVIVRSRKLAERLSSVPGVEVRAQDAEYLGWWVIFPESMRALIEPVFREKTIVTEHAAQLSLLDIDAGDAGNSKGEPPEKCGDGTGEGNGSGTPG